MRRHWLAGIMTVVALFVTATAARAEHVRMKDGTQYDGEVQSETDSNLQIEVSNAAGTIFHSVDLKKSDIAEIIRPTAAEKAATEMEEAYKQVAKYQLNPQYSQPLPYCDQVISNVFQAFLTKYPASPHEKDVQDLITNWTEERDKVATGLARFGKDWLPKEEVDRRTEEIRVQNLIDNGHRLAARGQYEEALQQFRAVLDITHRKDLVDQAKASYTDVGKMWSDALERLREPLQIEIKTYQEQLDHLHGERDQAASKLQSVAPQSSDDNRRLGQEALAAEYRLDFATLRDQYQMAEKHLFELKQQLSTLEVRISQVKTIAAAGNALVVPGEKLAPPKPAVTAAPPVVVVAPPPAPEPATPDVLVQVADMFKRYWMIGLVGFVLIAWGCTRMFSR